VHDARRSEERGAAAAAAHGPDEGGEGGHDGYAGAERRYFAAQRRFMGTKARCEEVQYGEVNRPLTTGRGPRVHIAGKPCTRTSPRLGRRGRAVFPVLAISEPAICEAVANFVGVIPLIDL
jgi:hypothetical protein